MDAVGMEFHTPPDQDRKGVQVANGNLLKLASASITQV